MPEALSSADSRRLIDARLSEPIGGLLRAQTNLRHFAIVTYAIPPARLAGTYDPRRFELDTVRVGGAECALYSIVHFVDTDFGFPGIAPWLAQRFPQTNHRIYIRDRRSGDPCVWFLGTTLGSRTVAIPRFLWKMPWHRAAYRDAFRYSRAERRYTRYRMEVSAVWGALSLDLADSGEPAPIPEGFFSRDEFILVLTHPVRGYFRRLDGRLATYRIGHPEMTGLTRGEVRALRMGWPQGAKLVPREEALRPHSVLLLPQVRFRVELPPQLVG